MRKEVLVGAALIIFLLSTGFFAYLWDHRLPVPAPKPGRVNVVASFYPVAEFARNVGGNLVSVTTVTPADAEPHDYEPTLGQVTGAYQAKVFFLNGGGVDPWAERIAPDLIKQGVLVANMSSVIPQIPLGSGFDPHFWLDPVLAVSEVNLIRDTLMKADPGHAAEYSANADAYDAQLTSLAEQYASGLHTCGKRTVITSHAAFAYLAKRYGFDVIPISGISPEAEPSAEHMAEIEKIVKENGIKYIYLETLASPKLSQSIASDTGAGTLVFNPLEGLTDQQIASGADYISIMQENLKNLELGMECK